ncbi:MAG: carboxypeptidase regulatory-like domain-containing protein [Planctomycetales bacterium]|nr:carboxypeptidase regulatory-like domain-containing protein [Planctomycetales bacterium]
MKRFCFALVVFVLPVIVAGCGPDLSHLPKTVVAEGIVTLDGAPVETATVVFIAEQGTYSARGITDAEGKFALQAFDEKPGAVPGSYRVQVNKTILSESGGGEDENSMGSVSVTYGLPKRYAAVSTSGLKVTIPDMDSTDIKLELKGN